MAKQQETIIINGETYVKQAAAPKKKAAPAVADNKPDPNDPNLSPLVAEFLKLMTEEDATKYLGLKAAGTLRNLRSKGGGPKFQKLGSAVRYKKDDLDQYLSDKAKASQPTKRKRK